jgi:cell division transport system permease protein
MFRAHRDLPLTRDPAIRILPWIVGLMVYLATMTLAGALLVSGLATQWSAGLTGTLTIYIAATEDQTSEKLESEVKNAIRLALKTPGVATARAMPPDAVAALLAPWLGEDMAIAELPLPRIVDVRLAEDSAIDIAAFKRRLESDIPGAGLDDHQLWRDRLVTFLRVIEAIAVVMVSLIGVTTLTMVVFATRSGLAVHGDTIEVLHLIGAHDDYIAGQFQSQAWWLGMQGGAVGSIAGIGTLLGLAFAATNLGSDLFPLFLFQLWHWPVLATVPLIAAFIVRQTARRTVLRALDRML